MARFRFTSSTAYPDTPKGATLTRRRVIFDTLLERDRARGIMTRGTSDGWRIAEAVFYDRAELLPYPRRAHE